ncbi:MAG: class 1 fructose-bisphosphatase, partial [Bacteroidetes bacterium]|nr:class 1 fructose-bisphosphatase [Bacteroidota bacterium]
MPQNKVITLERHIIEGERAHPGATGNFSNLLRDLTLAIKIIWREVSKAGLVNILGAAGTQNIHGDQVKKLDMFADDVIFKAMDHTGHLCVMGSEEHEEILKIPS